MNIDFAMGLHIVGFLASRGNEPQTSETLAGTFGTSPVVLRRVLARLNRSGLLESRSGAGGGSVLARPATQINLRQVYESVNVNQELFRRHPQDKNVVAKVLGEYINGLYDEAERSLLAQLEAITVAEMDADVGPQICAAIKRGP